MYRVYCDGKVLHDIRDPSYTLRSPKLTLELNKTGSFSFEILPTHPHANGIKRLSSIITVEQDDEVWSIEADSAFGPAGTNVVWTSDGKWDNLGGIVTMEELTQADIDEICV